MRENIRAPRIRPLRGMAGPEQAGKTGNDPAAGHLSGRRAFIIIGDIGALEKT